MRSKAKEGHCLIGFHSKAQCEGPKSPPGFPGPHGLTVGPGGLRVVPNERKCDFLSEYIRKSNLAIELRCRQNLAYEA